MTAATGAKVVSPAAGVPVEERALAWVRARLAGLDDFERLFYTGLVLASIGLAGVWLPLAFLLPGCALAAVALLFRLRSP